MEFSIVMEAAPCVCPIHQPKPYRPLSILMLECWQRRYDQRPYNTLLINRVLFENAFNRILDNNDYKVLIEFVKRGQIDNFELIYMPLPPLSVCQVLLRILANLTHVSLCHVDMSPAHLETLLEKPCSFISLRLSGNAFTQQHADILRTFLLESTTIAYLDVGYCSIDPIVFATVADGIHNSGSLKAVDVSRLVQCNSVHMMDSSKIAVIIAMLLWSNTINEFHGKHLNMDGHDILPIVECLNRCENLVYLDLGSNRIGAYGAKHVFEAIKSTPNLIGLDISNNNLGEHGGLEISNHLAFTKIRYLDIGHNGITAPAMTQILQTIKKAVPLRIFNIIGNHFDYEVGKVMRRALDARVLMLNAVDVKTTYDLDEGGFRIVPLDNDRSRYNYRYFRVQPFIRKYDVAPNLLWHDVNPRKLLVNALFIDPIFVDFAGRVYTLDAKGKRTESENTQIYNF